MGQQDDFGRAFSSHNESYEPVADNPWVGLDQEDARNEPILDDSDGAFSFSEEDLVPTASPWDKVPDRNAFGGRSKRDGDRMYSQLVDDQFEPKITIDRAYVVSEPREPSLPRRSPSPDDRKARGLSRALTNFRRRSKSRPRSSTVVQEPTRGDSNAAQALDSLNGNSRSNERKREPSPGRVEWRPATSDEPGALAWLLRRKSSATPKNKRQSFVNSWRTQSPIIDEPPRKSSRRMSGVALPSTNGSQVHYTKPGDSDHPVRLADRRDRTKSETQKPRPQDMGGAAGRPRTSRRSDNAKSLKVDMPETTASGRAPANSPDQDIPNPITLLADKAPRQEYRTPSPDTSALLSPVTSGTGEDLTARPSLARSKSKRMSFRATRPTDDLWPKFRALEHDYQKFLTKPLGSSAPLIEANLIPFLKEHADDTTAENLHHDYLKRRCVILNRWWMELMDVIDDWENDNASYRERSLALDASISIMQRPEWRRVPEYAPSSQSLNDDLAADVFQLHQIYRNLRDMFDTSLLRLCAIMVQRLSSNEGTGAITRAGGLCIAYAFFFCPNVAENLVRLWRIPSNVIRKVRESVKVETPEDLSSTAAALANHFPDSIRDLQYGSSRTIVALLSSQSMELPLEVKVDWHNEVWLDRWCGRKSDLFFIFIKHYHLLVDQFLPEGTSNTGLLCVPGMLLVQAQMSLVLRSALTSKQGSGQPQTADDAPSATIDVLLDADTTTIKPTASSRETVRNLTGRRLIMLMKEILGASRTRSNYLFAQSCRNMLRAAARQVSLFDHEACFNLCDFLEQGLTILTRYGKTDHGFSDDDAAFWADVFKQMLRSNNTLTAVRLFALLYTIWPEITQDPPWKHHLSYKLLLEEQIFTEYFQHWCPIVRVYYMRLLAWRVARLEAWHNDGDLRILKTLYFRIQESWIHHQHVLTEASAGRCPVPSTAPCNPIPGRRMLIVRLDSPPSTVQPSASQAPSSTATRRLSGYGSLVSKLSNASEAAPEQSKRRSGLFRSLTVSKSDRSMVPEMAIDDSSTSAPQSSEAVVDGSDAVAPDARASMYESRPGIFQPLLTRSNTKGKKDAKKPGNTAPASFKFSLELVERHPISDMKLSPPKLPLAAQMVLESQPNFTADAPAAKPIGTAAAESARYAGRALAEWSLAVNECQNFFERRRKEGVPSNDLVETPTLGVESFRRPG